MTLTYFGLFVDLSDVLRQRLGDELLFFGLSCSLHSYPSLAREEACGLCNERPGESHVNGSYFLAILNK